MLQSLIQKVQWYFIAKRVEVLPCNAPSNHGKNTPKMNNADRSQKVNSEENPIKVENYIIKITCKDKGKTFQWSCKQEIMLKDTEKIIYIAT